MNMEKKNKMNICFILPGQQRRPVGGYKIVFEYANRLAREGHNISLLFLNKTSLQTLRLPNIFKRMMTNVLTQIEPTWFPLDKRVKKISGLSRKLRKKIGNIDICISTAITTYSSMDQYFPKTKHAFLIQGYETWMASEDELVKAYSGNNTNITVSKWLKSLVDNKSGKMSYLIQNPIDLNAFKSYCQLNSRAPHTISCLYHSNPCKGASYLMESLQLLKIKYIDLEVYMFGVPNLNKLPNWIHYTKCASQAEVIEIYNKTRVFLCTSIEEGYGLTGLEAMACETCLVSTNYAGALEYAVDGYNSILAESKNVDSIVACVEKVFDNDVLQKCLTENGKATVQDFSWEKACFRMLEILDNI